MKKLLALVLALVMTLSLCVTSNAAYTDAADIEHTEAVEVLSALGVINGKPNGGFDPKGTVTRAEMAKMITIIALGDVDVTAFQGTTTNLKDVNGHWAEAYIKYCYSQGVIAGKGAGLFDPNANVTAVEAAKMLLVALGYNAEVQVYTGADWAINVTRDAQLSGFYDDLVVASSAALTRDQAAQMIYNAVNATLIKKTSGIGRIDGKITDSYSPWEGHTLLSETFGAKTWVGTFNGNYETGNTGNNKDSISVTGKLDDGTHAGTAILPSDLDIANIGEEVKVIFKDGKAGTDYQPDKKDTIYGVYNTGATEVLNVTSADIKTAADYSTAGKLKIAGVEYKIATPANSTVIIVKNYGATTAVSTDADATVAESKTAFSALNGANGDKVKFVLNSDGEVAKAYVTASVLTYVTAVNSEKVTLSGIGAIKVADNEVYDGIAKNDAVVVTKLYKTAVADATFVVEKAEVVSGKVTGFKGTESVTLDGTTYKVYNKALMPTSFAGETGLAQFANASIGETFDLYMVNGYVAAAVQTSEDASNYSLVIAKNSGDGTTFNETKLQVLGADGEKTTLVVDKDSAVKAASGYDVGDIVTYTGTADNALVTIVGNLGSNVASAGTFYDKDAKTLEGTVTTSNCVLFVQTTAGTYKAYNVRDLKKITAAGTEAAIKVVKDSKVVAAYINLGSAPSGATSKAVYGIVTGSLGVVEIDDVYYNVYTIASNDTTYTVNIKASGTNDTLTKGDIVGFAPTSDNEYANNTGFAVLSASGLSSVTVDGTTYTADVVAVKDYNDAESIITYFTGLQAKKADGTNAGVGDTVAYYAGTGETTKAVADNVTVVYVNVDDDVAGDEIGVASFDSIGGYMNAIVVFNSDGAVTHIIVETSGEAQVYAQNA